MYYTLFIHAHHFEMSSNIKHLYHYYIPCLLTGVCLPASAGILDEPYLFRFALAMDRQSNSAATLGRQASIAYPDASSMNPGAGDWIQYDKQTTHASINYVEAKSASGARIQAAPVTARLSDPDRGSMSVAFAYTSSPSETGWNNLNQGVSSKELFLGYSKRCSQKTSLGGQLRLVDAHIKNEFLSTELGGQPARLTTDLMSYDFSLGALSKLDEKVMGGMAFTYSFGEASNVLQNLTPLGPIPSGTILATVSDVVRSSSLRGGIGYELNSAFGIYSDLHLNHIETNQTGSASMARMAVGAEYHQPDRLTVRGGLSLDTDNQVSSSISIGSTLYRKISWEIAYQNNTAPEIRPEYGRFKLLSTSLSATF